MFTNIIVSSDVFLIWIEIRRTRTYYQYTCIYITLVIINDIGCVHSFTIGTVLQDTNLHLDDNGTSCTNNHEKFLHTFFDFYQWELNGNFGDVAYSLVKMSNNKHYFASLIFLKQHFHYILHLNSIVRGKIAFPKPRSDVFIFVAISIMSCDITDQYFPHSRLSTEKYTMGKKL